MKVKVLFCFIGALLILTSIVIAGQTKPQGSGQSVDSTVPKSVDKQNFSTDLGKGLPYPGLTEAEKAKILEISRQKANQPVAPVLFGGHEMKLAPVLTTSAPATPSVTTNVPQSKPEELKTDPGKDLPYPGITSQEQDKLQGRGGK